MDSLFQEIYDRQVVFEDLIIKKNAGKGWPDKKLVDFDDKERTTFSKELALYLYQEIAEFVNAVGNYKMHKTQKFGGTEKDIKEEIADLAIFVIDMAITHKMMPQELLEIIKRKQDKNFKRQEEGY